MRVGMIVVVVVPVAVVVGMTGIFVVEAVGIVLVVGIAVVAVGVQRRMRSPLADLTFAERQDVISGLMLFDQERGT